MPEIYEDKELASSWSNELMLEYENENARTEVHVSDLLLCLRQTVLLKTYQPKWDIVTLFRFTMGRALEKAFFKLLLPSAVEELEVREEGVVGHVDFGTEDKVDFECKLTWSRVPESAEDLLESKHWWFDQAGMYAVMRRVRERRFVVLFLFPIPQLKAYRVLWSKKEQGELWDRMMKRKEYLEKCLKSSSLPMKTPLTWLCKGCSVEYACKKKRD